MGGLRRMGSSAQFTPRKILPRASLTDSIKTCALEKQQVSSSRDVTVEVPEILSYLITIAIGIFPAKTNLSNSQVVYLKCRHFYYTVLQS